ncbi:hypothetical protein DFJ74DRAFT_705342 [Hyaloraphidium curvatum]|nr:hypothetical protein DFJ74DRAFT_705342 [Hyaloraphidium curvatum]
MAASALSAADVAPPAALDPRSASPGSVLVHVGDGSAIRALRFVIIDVPDQSFPLKAKVKEAQKVCPEAVILVYAAELPKDLPKRAVVAPVTAPPGFKEDDITDSLAQAFLGLILDRAGDMKKKPEAFSKAQAALSADRIPIIVYHCSIGDRNISEYELLLSVDLPGTTTVELNPAAYRALRGKGNAEKCKAVSRPPVARPKCANCGDRAVTVAQPCERFLIPEWPAEPTTDGPGGKAVLPTVWLARDYFCFRPQCMIAISRAAGLGAAPCQLHEWKPQHKLECNYFMAQLASDAAA